MDDTTLPLPSGSVLLRRARLEDLSAIVELLADDPVSASRGDTARAEDRPAYERAFAAIAADPAQTLLVATSADDEVVGTMQLTVIPGLARAGSSRLQIEAVRVRSDQRSRGIGGAMIRWAMESAPSLGRSWCNSPPIRHASTLTGSTSGSGSRPRTSASSTRCRGNLRQKTSYIRKYLPSKPNSGAVPLIFLLTSRPGRRFRPEHRRLRGRSSEL